MGRPTRAIQLLPNPHWPYQRNPMTIAATVARMIAIQFIYPPPHELRQGTTPGPLIAGPCDPTRSRTRLKQGHEHPHLARVRLIRRAEARAKQALLGRGAYVQRRVGHQHRARDENEVPGREARAREVQRQARVDGMTDEPVGTGADELVVAVELELEVVVPAQGEDRPEREADPCDGAGQPGPADGFRERELGSGSERDDQVGDEEEVRDVVREAAGPN